MTAYVTLGPHGVEQDRAAVQAGLTLPINNGQVEGHVTRVKLIKRMFTEVSYHVVFYCVNELLKLVGTRVWITIIITGFSIPHRIQANKQLWRAKKHQRR